MQKGCAPRQIGWNHFSRTTMDRTTTSVFCTNKRKPSRAFVQTTAGGQVHICLQQPSPIRDPGCVVLWPDCHTPVHVNGSETRCYLPSTLSNGPASELENTSLLEHRGSCFANTFRQRAIKLNDHSAPPSHQGLAGPKGKREMR